MGCDIHSFAEHKVDGKWIQATDFVKLGEFDRSYYKKDYGSSPFDWRCYGIFAFLAGVRNYSHCECITSEPRGLPIDSELLNAPLDKPESFTYGGYSNGIATTKGETITCDIDYHSHSHIYLNELLEFDYDKVFLE